MKVKIKLLIYINHINMSSACLNYTNNPGYLYNSLFTGEITN